MRKTVLLMGLIMAFLLPASLWSQTSEDNWISLGEYIQGTYKKQGKYLVPNYPNNFLYISKLAYKTPEEDVILPQSNLVINKLNHVENHGIPVFDKDEPLLVNQVFEISQNGKPANDYVISDGEDGWKIIDLNGVGSLTSVLIKKKSKTSGNDIFDHIYVTLNPSQDPYKIKEEILKAKKESEKQARARIQNSSNESSPGFLYRVQ